VFAVLISDEIKNVTVDVSHEWNDDDAITHDPLRMRITNLN
jgi:hypothetical protein